MYDSRYWINEVKRSKISKKRALDQKLKIVDLFSGCGGLTLGAQMACAQSNYELEIKLAADLWSEAIDVYKQNFKDFLINSEVIDLSKAVKFPGSHELTEFGQKLCNRMGDVDVIMAGPPCQGHSDLNNASRRDDPRNLLYTIPVAFALSSNAKILLIENVPAVVHSSDKVVNVALKALSDRGFTVTEIFADAQNFGLPQTRRRHLIVASRVHTPDEIDKCVSSIAKRTQDVPLWPFISDLERELENESLITKRSKMSDENKMRIAHLFKESIYDLPNSLRPPCHRDKNHSYVSMYGRLHANRPAQTITSGFGSMGQGRFVHPTQPRLITAHEAARIQGFPDYFRFDTVKKITALREMIGNAVPPAIPALLLSLLIPGISNGDREN